MGVCPSLQPQTRVINKKNTALKQLMINQLKNHSIYHFYRPLRQQINKIPLRYLFNQGIIQDIDKIKFYSSQDSDKFDQSKFMSFQENLDDQIKNSCLILQDQQNPIPQSQQKNENDVNNPTSSFLNNMKNNQSLLVQINILYQQQFDKTHYKNSLKMFLKWVQIFNQHSYGGFLKPIYKQFCNTLYTLPKNQTQTIIDQTNTFVQYLIKIYIEIYGLKAIYLKQNGRLFKQENIFNLIMSYLFRRTKIKIFLRDVLKINNHKKTQNFAIKLEEQKDVTLKELGVPEKFILKNITNVSQESSDLINNQISSKLSNNQHTKAKKKGSKYPYQSCIKMTQQLCCKSKTPITKLKLIVNIAKQIMAQIRQHYQQKKIEPPQMDPDSLMTIIMYIIIKCGDASLLEQIKLVQYFTTKNCLNCISGYYLNMFLASIEMILNPI